MHSRDYSQLTTTSMRELGEQLSARATMRLCVLQSRRSAMISSILPSSTALTLAFSLLVRQSTQTTRPAPCFTNASLKALPMPEEVPVTLLIDQLRAHGCMLSQCPYMTVLPAMIIVLRSLRLKGRKLRFELFPVPGDKLRKYM